MVYEGRYYGTLKSELKRIRSMNKIPILDIDVKGAIHVQEQYPEEQSVHFCTTPIHRGVETEAEYRATESAEALRTGSIKPAYEISFRIHFNKIIINDNLQKACEEARHVISARSCNGT